MKNSCVCRRNGVKAETCSASIVIDWRSSWQRLLRAVEPSPAPAGRTSDQFTSRGDGHDEGAPATGDADGGRVRARDRRVAHDQYAARAARHVAGYVAEQSLTVTVRDISRAGKLDAAGVSAGAHSSEGPVFSLASKQRGYRAALAAAVKQARSQATAMAAAAG